MFFLPSLPARFQERLKGADLYVFGLSNQVSDIPCHSGPYEEQANYNSKLSPVH